MIVVGIGPGSAEYLTPAALAAIHSARVLVGSRRALDDFAGEEQLTRVINRDIESLLEFLREQISSDNVVIMVSGDPGFYSLLDVVPREFPADKIKIIPGISSLQYAFAKIGEPWHGATLASFHGRKPAGSDLGHSAGKLLGLLTDSVYNPAAIARTLLAAGWPEDSKVWLCSNLSYPDEQVVQLSLSETADSCGYDFCVVVVKG